MGSFTLGDFYLQKVHNVIMVNEGQREKILIFQAAREEELPF